MVKQLLFKILTVGDETVGKTTLLQRYVEGLFKETQQMTLGVDFYLKRLQHRDLDIALQLWDFAGQDRFRFLLKKYVKGASGALLLFDLTNLVTLESADEWVKLVRMLNPNLPIILVGTKYDIVNPKTIDNNLSNSIMAKFNLIANLITSSKTGMNVESVFDLLLKDLLATVKISNNI